MCQGTHVDIISAPDFQSRKPVPICLKLIKIASARLCIPLESIKPSVLLQCSGLTGHKKPKEQCPICNPLSNRRRSTFPRISLPSCESRAGDRSANCSILIGVQAVGVTTKFSRRKSKKKLFSRITIIRKEHSLK
jgi:hypothetical protein